MKYMHLTCLPLMYAIRSSYSSLQQIGNILEYTVYITHTVGLLNNLL